MTKSDDAYKTIGEVVKILGLSSKKGHSLPTHTIRFWEKNFKQIKPKILNGNRRYYDEKNIDILRKIHFLLKEKGMTIKGVKKILDKNKSLKLDEFSNQSINVDIVRKRLIKISNLLKSLKNNYGKKTHVKVRLVPESKPDSPFFYYVKKPAGGEKAKIKLKAKKYNPSTRKHEIFVEKNFHLTANNYFFLKFRFS